MTDTSRNQRVAHELAHGRKILTHAEAVWNWDSPAGRERAKRRADYLVEVGRITAADHVLEIGCGTGLFTEKIFEQTHARITAVDVSPELLKIAQEKIAGVDFKIEDAMRLSFSDETFDVVCGSSILHHLDIFKSYEEIFRVLKKGGRMVFAEPNMLNPQIFIQKNVPFIKKMLGDSPDEMAIVRWKAQKQLIGIGFKNVRIFPYDFLHPSTPSFLVPFVRFLGGILERLPLVKEIAGSVIIYAEK